MVKIEAVEPQTVAHGRGLYTQAIAVEAGRYPTNTLLVVGGLAHPDFLIEVEAIAVI